MGHNDLGIMRVMDITRFRPLPHGLVSEDQPWVTGFSPETGRTVWQDKVIF